MSNFVVLSCTYFVCTVWPCTKSYCSVSQSQRAELSVCVCFPILSIQNFSCCSVTQILTGGIKDTKFYQMRQLLIILTAHLFVCKWIHWLLIIFQLCELTSSLHFSGKTWFAYIHGCLFVCWTVCFSCLCEWCQLPLCLCGLSSF